MMRTVTSRARAVADLNDCLRLDPKYDWARQQLELAREKKKQ